MKRPGTDLKIREWKHDFQSYDYTNVFDLYVPTELNLGKNQIKIGLVGNRLEKESAISIDLIDTLGQPIYHEISNIANEDQTRSIIAHVYGDTPLGASKLYISANLAPPFQGKKYLYTTDILVDSSKEVASDFVFKEIPVVKYQEKTFYSTQTNGQASRLTHVSGTIGDSFLSLLSRAEPKQRTSNSLTVEKQQPTNVATKTPNGDSDTVQAETIELPKYFPNTVVTATGFLFTPAMLGGTIYLNNVDFPDPPNWSNKDNLTNLSFSSSIVKVIKPTSVEIYPPITLNTTYLDANQVTQNYNADRIMEHANFTCSFYDYPSTTAIPVTKSFAVFDVGNLATDYGKVDSIKITYKPVNEVGDFRHVGTFKANSPVNFLTDASSSNRVEFAQDGLVEKSFGRFATYSDFMDHWSAFNGSIDGEPASTDLKNGFLVWDNMDTGEYVGFRLSNPEATPKVFENTELALKFNWMVSNPTNAQMDVYVSGVPVMTYSENAEYKPVYYEPSASSTIGNTVAYLGSLTGHNKNHHADFRFKTLGDGNLNVLFLFKRGGYWGLGDIELIPVAQSGTNQSQTRIVAPLDNLFVTGSELIVKLDYIGSNGKIADYSSNLYGVKFDGARIAPKTSYEPVIMKKTMTFFDNFTFNQFETDNSHDPYAFKFDVTLPTDGYAYHTASSAGFTYQMTYNIVGITGSMPNPKNKWVWGGTVQGRAYMNDVGSPSEAVIFQHVSISGSTADKIGGFGTNPIGVTNLDSWLKAGTSAIHPDGQFQYSFTLYSTSSFYWTAYLSAQLELFRYQYKT